MVSRPHETLKSSWERVIFECNGQTSKLNKINKEINELFNYMSYRKSLITFIFHNFIFIIFKHESQFFYNLKTSAESSPSYGRESQTRETEIWDLN